MQQVNLYSDILKQQQKQSGIKLAIVMLAGLTLLCVSFSAYLFWNTRKIEIELHHAHAQLASEQVRVNELLAKRPRQEPNLLLIAELEQWQKSINEAAQTLQLLTGKETMLSQGFSAYLQALADQSSPEVWLTAIHIDGQNRGMRLEGSTFKPEHIPQALQQLQQERAFKGQTFAKLNMQKSANVGGQIDFTLSSSEQLLPAKDHAH